MSFMHLLAGGRNGEGVRGGQKVAAPNHGRRPDRSHRIRYILGVGRPHSFDVALTRSGNC